MQIAHESMSGVKQTEVTSPRSEVDRCDGTTHRESASKLCRRSSKPCASQRHTINYSIVSCVNLRLAFTLREAAISPRTPTVGRSRLAKLGRPPRSARTHGTVPGPRCSPPLSGALVRPAHRGCATHESLACRRVTITGSRSITASGPRLGNVPSLWSSRGSSQRCRASRSPSAERALVCARCPRRVPCPF